MMYVLTRHGFDPKYLDSLSAAQVEDLHLVCRASDYAAEARREADEMRALMAHR